MLRLFLLVAVAIAPVWSNSSGAPDKICTNNLTPQHGPTPETSPKPQKSPSPYTLTGADSVKSGDILKLTLSGDEFLGFALQARDSEKKPIGSFKANAELSQTLKCSANDDTLTHRKLKAPINSLSIEWKAPPSAQDVTFYATVVKTGEVFWVGQTKNVAVV